MVEKWRKAPIHLTSPFSPFLIFLFSRYSFSPFFPQSFAVIPVIFKRDVWIPLCVYLLFSQWLFIVRVLSYCLCKRLRWPSGQSVRLSVGSFKSAATLYTKVVKLYWMFPRKLIMLTALRNKNDKLRTNWPGVSKM